MSNLPTSLLNEEDDISTLNQITESLELNIDAIPRDFNLINVCNSLLLMAQSDNLIIAIIKCVTAYIKKNIQFCYEIINKGLYFKLLALRNPRQNNPKISLDVAIAARHALMQVFSHKEIIAFRSKEFEYGIFTDNIFDFPLAEQKLLTKITRDLSLVFTNDVCAYELTEISQLLTHFDMQIVENAAYILYNCFSKGTQDQLKIIDPVIAKYISTSLEVITDSQIVLVLLEILRESCKVSYEYAEQIIDLPIDFEIIIHNIGTDPRVDVINTILEIIQRVFSFLTLRKGDIRNQKISKFAFYIQPLLIKLINQNLGNIALVLEILSITFDVYIPILELNNILDAIVYLVSSGNKSIKINSFYKKLIENQKIQNAINQYDSLNITKPNAISHITDFKSFIDASNLHSSSFAINESLQKSILKILKNISSKELIKKAFSTENYLLMKESLIKIVITCQKTIIFNTNKLRTKAENTLTKEQIPPQIHLTLFDQKGKTIFINVPSATILSICETFFNFIQASTPQWECTNLPMDSAQNSMMYLTLNNLNDIINPNLINNDHKIALFNHFLCYKPNQRFTSPENYAYYHFYYFKIQGKIYSIFDNCFTALIQSNGNQVELIEIPKSEKKLTEEDFMNRTDIIHKYKTDSNEVSIINFDAFHESFNLAYPTLNLQKRSFDYYDKVTMPGIELSLRILKEIHRLFPHLHETETTDINNNDNKKNIDNDNSTNDSINHRISKFKSIFENEAFGWRLLEKFNFISIFATNMSTTSTFINFPFLFPFEQRLIFLKLTAFSHIKSCITLLSNIFLDKEDYSAMRQQMNVTIDKEKLFENGLIIFNNLSPGSIYYNVHFKGENGTGLGPTQEFFRLFALELQKNKHDIWLSDNKEDKEEIAFRKEERGLFPSPSCVSRPDLFFTLGSLCAKAIEMEVVLPIHFSPSFFDLIRGEPVKLEKVSSFYARSILNKKGLIGLPFTLPGQEGIELRNGGKVLVTDEENVDLYIELLRRVMTFDVFNINKENEDKKKKAHKNNEKNSPLSSVSSNAWKNLQRSNSATVKMQSIQQEEIFTTETAKSNTVRLKRGESAVIPSLSDSNSTSFQSNSSSSNSNSNVKRSSSSSSSSSVNFINSISVNQNNNNGDDDSFDEYENGEDEDIVPSEIADFIQRYSFECCSAMFREGFGRVIPWPAMNLFTSDEICRLIEGEEDFSMESLKENIVVGAGYESNSVQIKWLFEVISDELSPKEKKLLARFLTGSDTFGIFGLKSLVPRLSISKSEKGDDSLPSCSTCTNCLKLPEYQSKEALKKKLLYAIYECNENFYM